MRKKLIYLSILPIFLASCEEYYTPKIDTVAGQLVVEAVITNDPSQNFVHLTKTSSFYDKIPSEAVSGARIELVEINGDVIEGAESTSGYFNFNTIPVIGKDYMLRIFINNDIYESEVVTMPPMPSIIDFYTGHIEKKEYITDGYGVPYANVVIGREFYIDAPAKDSLANYRFISKAVLEWVYIPHTMSGPPPPPVYGWQAHTSNDLINIAGPKKFSQTGKIEKQPIMFFPYDAHIALLPDTTTFLGWIVIINQYGTSRGSFEYHEKLNSQFAADGSLFDPIQTQIYGNITCKTDSAKKAFGYFDLNSYRQYRYFLFLYSPDGAIKLRQIFRYPSIPDSGSTVGIPPDWWE